MATQAASLRYDCPHCGQVIVYGPEHCGVAGACPHCTRPITIPDAPDETLHYCDCPNCGGPLEYDDSLIGSEIRCPRCEQPLTLPTPEHAEASVVSAPNVQPLPDGFAPRQANAPSVKGQSASVGRGSIAFFFAVLCSFLLAWVANDFQSGERLWSWILPQFAPWQANRYLFLSIGIALVAASVFGFSKDVRARLIAECAVAFEVVFLAMCFTSGWSGFSWLGLGAAGIALGILDARLIKTLRPAANLILAFVIVIGGPILNANLFPPLRLNEGLFGDASGTMDVYRFSLSDATFGSGERGTVVVSYNRKGGGTLSLETTEQEKTYFTRWIRKGNKVIGEAKEVGKDGRALNFTMTIVAADRIGFSFSVEDATFITVLTKNLREVRQATER